MKHRLICLVLVVACLLGMGTVAFAADAMQISTAGMQMIASYEGFSATAYSDGGKWYIGYGTTCNPEDYPDGITEEQAAELLRTELDATVQQVNAFLSKNGISCSQNQFDALVSFTYTLGTSWMNTGYRFASCLISGQYTDLELVDAMVIWSHIGNQASETLIARRIAEAKLFLYGDYGDGNSPDYTYLILHAANGNIDSDIVCYEVGKAYGTLPTATRDGYTFAGWVAENGTVLTAEQAANKGQTVTAKWETVSAATLFRDVPDSAWYLSYVSDLSRDHVVDGYPDGTFRPTGTVTYGQALKLVLLASGYPEQKATGTHWASGYLALAERQKIVTAGAISNLDAAISRNEIAAMAAKALDLPAPTTASPYADTSDTAALQLYEAGIMEGSLTNGQRLFHGEKSISRSELCATIWRINALEVPSRVIQFRNQTIEILQGVPVNHYQKENFYIDGNYRGYRTDTVKTLIGIDVSLFQGTIDWEQVKASGVDYAMLRVGGRGYGNGVLYHDSTFARNLQGAKAAGIKVGAYFFSQACSVQEAQEEAEYALQLLDGAELDYPLVFDWEVIGSGKGRADNLDTDTLGACANRFCETVADAGYTPMIYVSLNTGYLKYDLRQVADYDLWLAEYSSTPSFYYDFQMWQYTDSGTVPGINGKVDLNMSFVDYSA